MGSDLRKRLVLYAIFTTISIVSLMERQPAWSLQTRPSTLGCCNDGCPAPSVEAYRDALQERTRERVPLQWAATQNNLGTALTTLGRRKKQPQLLRDALEAVSRATEVYRAA